MNKKENKLIPELCFPEFENEGEWKIKLLGKIASITTGSSNREDSNLDGKYTFFDRSQDIRNSNRYLFDKEAIIVPGEGQEFIPKYFEGKFDLHQRTYAIFDFINTDGKYLFYFISQNDKYLLSQAVGSTVKSLRLPMFEAMPIVVPKLQEQQKIAACLSSLDEVIEAHNQKLELLKDHKKGLMQNLFPQEGEKVPKLRFKEFEKDGEWEIKELNELGDLINGLTYSPDDVREKGLLVLRSSNVQNGLIDLNDCVYVRTDIQGANLSKPSDILVCVRNGSKNLIGKNAIIPKGLPLATHGAFMTVFRASNPEFVFQLFQTDFYDTQVKADLGATINSINGKNFLKYEFPIPENPKEQNKIAKCLSSLDEIITAQIEKIEELKLHKKGLMQGLFPKMDN